MKHKGSPLENKVRSERGCSLSAVAFKTQRKIEVERKGERPKKKARKNRYMLLGPKQRAKEEEKERERERCSNIDHERRRKCRRRDHIPGYSKWKHRMVMK